MQTVTTVKKTQQPTAKAVRRTPSERPHKELTQVQEEVAADAVESVIPPVEEKEEGN